MKEPLIIKDSSFVIFAGAKSINAPIAGKSQFISVINLPENVNAVPVLNREVIFDKPLVIDVVVLYPFHVPDRVSSGVPPNLPVFNSNPYL